MLVVDLSFWIDGFISTLNPARAALRNLLDFDDFEHLRGWRH